MKIIMAIIAGMVLASNNTDDLLFIIADNSNQVTRYNCEYSIIADDGVMSVKVKVRQNFTDELRSEFNSENFSIRYGTTTGEVQVRAIQFAPLSSEMPVPFARDFLVSEELFEELQNYFQTEEVLSLKIRRIKEAPPSKKKQTPKPRRHKKYLEITQGHIA